MAGALMMRWLRFYITGLLVSALFVPFFSEARSSDVSPIAIVYPEVGKPYQDVIDSIIQGIRLQTGSTIELFELKDDADRGKLDPWLAKHEIKMVIALGKQGLEATDKLPDGTKRILGALLTPPLQNGLSYAGGISLAPDPAIVFAKVRQLSAGTRRVFIVYDPESNGWLIELAKPAAAKSGLELMPRPAKDLRGAAAIYAELQQKGLGKTDLIWLLNDPNTVDQNTILPFLLKTSWSDGFAVISNNPSHVKRGVLFSLYPDYKGMGKSLGRLAVQVTASGDTGNKNMFPLRDVSIAVNLRTAEHLDLVYSQKEQDTFDLIFPESR